MLQPIETSYDGYLFKSKLEGQWAVFYNTLGIEYHYEPEGYELGQVRYLPDFYLPDFYCWIEIKGIPPTAIEKEKAGLLANQSGRPVYIFCGGIPWPNPKDEKYLNQSAEVWFPNGTRGWSYWWTECKHCGKLSIEERGLLFCCYEDQPNAYDSKRLRTAYYTARSYRF